MVGQLYSPSKPGDTSQSCRDVQGHITPFLQGSSSLFSGKSSPLWCIFQMPTAERGAGGRALVGV